MKIELHHINLSTDKVDEMNEFLSLLFQMVKSKLTWQKKT